MSLPIAPAAGASPLQSTGRRHDALTRLSGLGLTLIAVGLPLVIAAAIGLSAFAVIDLVRRTSAEITAIAAVVEDQLSPQIEKIESAFGRIAAPLSELKNHIDGAMTAIDQVGSMQIARGAWATTPSAHVMIPPDDLHVGSITEHIPLVGSVTKSLGTIDRGAVFNQATPSVPIPPEPVVLSMVPLQQALAPLGPNGAAGKAIKGVESATEEAVGEIGRLRQPILAARDGVAGLLTPLRAVFGPIASAAIVIVIALAAQVLLYLLSALVLIRRRPAEFMHALIARGPLGVLGYSLRALLQSGLAMALGRAPAPSQGGLIADLRTRAERLQMEIAALRAELIPSGAGTTALQPRQPASRPGFHAGEDE